MKKLWYIFLMLVILTACKEEKIITSEFTDGPKPAASFTYSKDYLKVTFQSTSTEAESFYWDFGDGAHSTEESPVHSYAVSGTYEVSLKVNSAAGYSSVSERVSIYVAGLAVPYFEYTFLDFLVVHFDASRSSNVKSAKWNFGDGSAEVEGIDAIHEFAAYGKYRVKLTVTGLLNDVVELEMEVSVGDPVVPVYTYESVLLLDVKFDASGSKNLKTAKWNFGDGSSEVQGVKVTHTFPAEGTYEVTLTLTGVLDDVVEIKFNAVVVNRYNLFNGSNMEAEDAKYWTVISNQPDIFNIGTWTVTFGYTDDKPSGGSGGCLSLTNIAANIRIYIYQVVDVVQGKNYKFSMEIKKPAYTGDDFYRVYIGSAASPPVPNNNTPIGPERFYGANATGLGAGYDGNTYDAGSPFNDNARNLWTAPSTGKFYVGFGIYAGAARPGVRILYDNVKFELVP